MSEWKPIDTAPKDRIIDVWLGNAEEYDVKFYCSEGTRRSVDWAWIEGKFRPFTASIIPAPTFIEPTHWMDRPSPPEETSDD